MATPLCRRSLVTPSSQQQPGLRCSHSLRGNTNLDPSRERFALNFCTHTHRRLWSYTPARSHTRSTPNNLYTLERYTLKDNEKITNTLAARGLPRKTCLLPSTHYFSLFIPLARFFARSVSRSLELFLLHERSTSQRRISLACLSDTI